MFERRSLKGITYTFLLVLCFTLIFALASCGGDDPSLDSLCEHGETKILEAKKATCTEDGLTEGSECALCGEILVEQETIPKAHKYTKRAKVKSTCKASGVEAHYFCGKCDTYFTADKVETTLEALVIPIDPDAHDIISHEAKATCTEIGWDAYDTCSRCSYTTYKALPIDPDAHDIISHKAKEATCTEIGWDAYDTCSRCRYTTYKEIYIYAEHTYGDDAMCAVCGFDEGSTEGLSYELINGGAAYKVVGIGSATGDTLKITSMYRGLSVVEIAKGAFEGCTKLKSIEIPSRVTSIGDYAFRNCPSLNSVTFAEGSQLTSIGVYAFYGCTSLNAVYISDIEAWLKISFSGSYANPLYNGANLYLNGSLVTEVTVPNTITKINDYAFSGCTSLKSIEIPSSVTSIGYSAFSGCTSLNAVYISDIEAWLKISFSDSAANPLCNGANLYLNGELVTEVTVPNTVTKINGYAFYGCTSLESVTIPNSVTSIGSSAFSGCSSLKEMTIPFVGGSKKTSSDTYQYPFGYIFGTSSYEGGVATSQSYYGYSTSSTTYDTYYIPSTLKKVTVTGGNILYGAFYGCSNIESIVISEGVTSIGSDAFAGCTSLESIEIPSSVTSIGSDAFSYCTSLEEITIPNSVTSIGFDAFSGCTSLESVIFADGSQLESIGSYAFYNCTSLKSIEIPSSVTSIGYSAFSGCRSLNAVYISDIEAWLKISFSVSAANPLCNGANLYLNGELVTEVTVPNTVTKINGYAFYGCTSLESVTIPNSVTSIGSSAFSGCSSLKEMTIPFVGGSKKTSSDTYQYPFGYIFGGRSYEGGVATEQYYYGYPTSSYTYSTYYIPSTLKKVTVTGGNILYGAFYGCSNIESIVISEGVTSIGKSAFYNCTSLKSIETPSRVTSIGEYAFSGCTSLKSITIPSRVTSIGEWAFSYCTSLESITIPSRVTSIGEYAFSGCDKLVEVYNLSSLNITKGSSSDGYVGYYALDIYTDINTPSKLSTTSDGYIFYSDGTNTYLIGYTGSDTKLTLPESYNGGTYKIYKYAFYQNDKITSVIIPQSVTSIGSSAFSGCTSLKSITIPNSVTSIGYSAFSGCSSLQEMTIPFVGGSIKTSSDKYQYSFGYIFGGRSYEGGVATEQYYYGYSTLSTTYDTYYIPSTLKKVTVTGGNILYGAFYGCSNIESIVISEGVTSIGKSAFYNCTSLKSIETPSRVTSIGEYAFWGCTSLKSITIPSRVTSIGEDAFSGCTSLESVTFADGSQLESIGYSAFEGCTSLKSITIPNSVTSIGSYAFSGCYKLVEVYNLSSLDISKGSEDYGYVGYYALNVYTATEGESKLSTTADGYVFYSDGANTYLMGYKGSNTELTLPESYNGGSYEIYKYAFYKNDKITSVTISNSVTSIGNSAFSGCRSLESITIPNSVKSIGSDAFSGCTSLESVTFADGSRLESIGEWAFEDCTSLVSITIPNSVTSIGAYAFSDCESLASVTFAEGSQLESIGSSAFSGCTSLNAVYISDIEAWLKIRFDAESANPLCYAKNLYLNGELVTEIEVPNTITEIYDYAFSGCTSLKSITIPSRVTSIGERAFSGCTSLTIYAEAASQPSGWSYKWNSSGCRVVWGYKGTQY